MTFSWPSLQYRMLLNSLRSSHIHSPSMAHAGAVVSNFMRALHRHMCMYLDAEMIFHNNVICSIYLSSQGIAAGQMPECQLINKALITWVP